MAHLSHRVSTGSFDWAHPHEKQQRVELALYDGGKRMFHVSVLFPVDEGVPTWDEMRPVQSAFEWLDAIQRRIESFWIYTARECDLATIAAFREYLDDERGLALEIESLERVLAPLREKTTKIEERLVWLRKAALAAAEMPS